MRANKSIICGATIFSFTVLSGIALTSPLAIAETSGDVNITATLPTACSFITTNNSLTKIVSSGVQNTIGTANLKAVCNDADGFAIYAVGYTGDQYGNNVLATDLTTNEHSYDIETGLGTGGDSNWNMTIANDATVTDNYAAVIQNGFDVAHVIPTAYTKIATLNASTDQSIGTNLTATFNTYISPSQPASIYSGKVLFALVHPIDAVAIGRSFSTKDVTVTFNAPDEDYFYLDGDNNPVRTNTVSYHGECETTHTPLEPRTLSTQNIGDGGTKLYNLSVADLEYRAWNNGGDGESGYYYYNDVAYFPEASRLKIVITYDFMINEENEMITGGDEESGYYSYYPKASIEIVGKQGNGIASLYGSGVETIIVNDNGANIGLWLDGGAVIESDHSDGFYATVYPLDENEIMMEEVTDCRCEWTVVEGEYMETVSPSAYAWWYEVLINDERAASIDSLLNDANGTELVVYPAYGYK